MAPNVVNIAYINSSAWPCHFFQTLTASSPVTYQLADVVSLSRNAFYDGDANHFDAYVFLDLCTKDETAHRVCFDHCQDAVTVCSSLPRIHDCVSATVLSQVEGKDQITSATMDNPEGKMPLLLDVPRTADVRATQTVILQCFHEKCLRTGDCPDGWNT